MIADCSLNAKAAMLHGLLDGYITTNIRDLHRALCDDIEMGLPDCYPRKKVLMIWLDRYFDGNDVEPEIKRSLERYLESEHCMCEHNDCRV